MIMKASPSSTLRKIVRKHTATPAPVSGDTPVMIALPQAVGFDDSAMIFRSVLLRDHADGVTLRDALDRLVRLHPQVAAMIISAGSLGHVSQGRAVWCIRQYLRTGVALPPETL